MVPSIDYAWALLNWINPGGEERLVPLQMKDDAFLKGRHEYWFSKYTELFGGVPPRLPPFCAVNHQILLIDKKAIYNYYLPQCTEAFKEQFLEKANHYTVSLTGGGNQEQQCKLL